MLNDYFAVSYLPIGDCGYIEELNIISRVYRSHSVDKIYLARNYDPSLGVSVYLSRTAPYFKSARKSLCSGVTLVPIHTVTLAEGVSDAELCRLAHKTPKGNYLYINVPIGIDRDVLAAELHSIIYVHKLIPVFVAVEAVYHFSSERVFDVILSVPNAVYLFSLPFIDSPDVRELIKRLIKNGKPVIFGSGTGFDGCPHKNLDFYIKKLKRAVGSTRYGYYLLKHDRFFR